MAKTGRRPDFSQLEKVLTRSGIPDYVPFYELFSDNEVMEAILKKPLTNEARVEYQLLMGYDYVGAGYHFSYPNRRFVSTQDTAYLPRSQRSFVDDNHGAIESRKDFDAYPWPVIGDNVMDNVYEMERLLPDGMKMLLNTGGGILENVVWLMGYVPFSYAKQDDEQLIWDMFEKIGTYCMTLLKLGLEKADRKKVGAIVQGDDMGYNKGTMLSPEDMRKYVFPWTKKLVDIAHSYDLPYILHSCGNLEEVMDDLIDYVGIDAKHSYEDKIMPVGEFKRKYGKRLTVLGGVDMDFLCTHNASEVGEYVSNLLDECMPGGGYALGSGNSLANYVPIDNIFAMYEVGRKKGIYR
jgi:uroporphyrinogen decarboxylase